MQKLRKTLSLLLAMTMLLTLPGISAGAADTDALPAGEETVVSDDISADSSVPAGDDAVSGAAGETVSQKTPESVDTTGKTPEDTAAAAEDGTAKQTAATEGTAEATEADQAAIPAAQSEEEKTEDGEDTEIPGNAVEKLLAEAEAGDTVILHSNDVHGAIDGYAYIAGVRDLLEKNGVNVILADAGDYSQGTTYVSTTKGADAVTMMNAAGYDVATLGNHEFDYGYAQLKANLGKAAFKVVCADVLENGSTIYDGCTIIEKGGVKIGFFGLETPEAQTKANPSLIQGLTFLAGQEMYTCAQQQADALKAAGADVVVGLVHLGVDAESAPNRSYDLWNNMKGVDFLIDGHSHTVMTKGDNGESIQSTGTAFANIGYVLIDKDTKKIESNGLIPVDESVPTNADVVAAAQTIIKRVDAEYA